MTSTDLARKVRELDRQLQELDSVVVAFSGGADSAFLLAAAAQSLGVGRVLAATSSSAALATGELAAASRFAADLGVEHLHIETAELARPGYADNGPDRCYHCKSELLDRLVALAAARSLAAVATGTNADDFVQPHRPGLRAGSERGVVTPLADAGLTKQDVRAASRAWNLPTWDKPQAACLASRIAYGVTVDAGRLERIDRAEAAARLQLSLVGIAVVDLRVRDLGDRARLEVDAGHLAAVTAAPSVLDAVRSAGFDRVELDPRGFRTGSLNESLSRAQLQPPPPGRGSWNLPIVD